MQLMSIVKACGLTAWSRAVQRALVLVSCASCVSYELEDVQLDDTSVKMMEEWMASIPLMVAIDRFVAEKERAPNDLDEVYAFAFEAGIEVAPELLDRYYVGLSEAGERALFFPDVLGTWIPPVSIENGWPGADQARERETVGLDLEPLEVQDASPVLIARGSRRGLSCYVALRASNGEVLYELSELQGDYRMGSSFTRIQDLDDDEHEDWIVQGLSRDHQPEEFSEGVVLVHSGRTGRRLRVDRRKAPCPRPDCRAADLITACGDQDGDSREDYAAVDRCGEMRLVSGASGETLRSVDLSRAVDRMAEVPPPMYQPGRWPADTLEAIGDVDGDQYPDLAVGCRSARPRDTSADGKGAIFIVSARSWELLDVVFGLGGEHAEMPGAVASMEDMDADGVPDFLFSAYTSNNEFNRLFREVTHPLRYVALVSGKTRKFLWLAYPFEEEWQAGHAPGLGNALGSISDRNADDIRDVAIGMQNATGPKGEGGVVVLSGADGAVIDKLIGGKGEYWGAALESVEGYGLFIGSGCLANGIELLEGSIRRVSDAGEWVWSRSPTETALRVGEHMGLRGP